MSFPHMNILTVLCLFLISIPSKYASGQEYITLEEGSIIYENIDDTKMAELNWEYGDDLYSQLDAVTRLNRRIQALVICKWRDFYRVTINARQYLVSKSDVQVGKSLVGFRTSDFSTDGCLDTRGFSRSETNIVSDFDDQNSRIGSNPLNAMQDENDDPYFSTLDIGSILYKDMDDTRMLELRWERGYDVHGNLDIHTQTSRQLRVEILCKWKDFYRVYASNSLYLVSKKDVRKSRELDSFLEDDFSIPDCLEDRGFDNMVPLTDDDTRSDKYPLDISNPYSKVYQNDDRLLSKFLEKYNIYEANSTIQRPMINSENKNLEKFLQKYGIINKRDIY